MENFRPENTPKQSMPHALHELDPEEEKALNRGTLSLATAMESEARKAAADPQYLDSNYGHIAAEQRIPIDDGSGDNLYLRAILYGVETNRDPAATALSIDDFRSQRLDPAAKAAFQSLRFTGKVSGPTDLKLTDNENHSLGISSQYTDVEAMRMSKNGDVPQSLAESIAADVWPLVINQPGRERWLDALHNDAIRLSERSPQWQNQFKEKLADFVAKGLITKTEILPGSVIDVKLFNSNGTQRAEVIASPDKPTSYNPTFS